MPATVNPIKTKVKAGASYGAGGGVLSILLAYYLDMPAEIAAAWSAALTWVANNFGAWVTRERT